MGTTAVVLLAVVALGGCVAIRSQSASQRAPGVVSLFVEVCASDRDRSTYATCDPTDPGKNTAETDNGSDALDDPNLSGQIMVGYRVPAGTIAPDGFDSVAAEVHFSASPSYTDALNVAFPPGPDARWFGYISTPKPFNLNNESNRSTSFRPEFTLPTRADGAPFSGPFLWRAVVGMRGASNPAAPVSCPAPNPNPNQFCFDSPTHTVVRGSSLMTTVSDFGVMDGSAATAGHGQTATVSFPVQYIDDSADTGGEGPQDLTITASTTLPGTTATPSTATLHLEPDTSGTVNVRVPVPAATPLGSYSVTLSAAAGSPAVTRSNTATIQVTDNLAPGIRIGTPAEGARFVFRRAIAADYACSEETNGSGLAGCSGSVAPGAPLDTGSLGRKTFSVVATDKAGNNATATTFYTVVPRPAPPIKLAFNFGAARTFTTFSRLVVKGVPKGSRVRVTCRPKRNGRICPVNTFTKRRAAGKVKLKSYVRKRFGPGTVIAVRVTKRGSIGAVKLMKIRAGAAPTVFTRCLPPDARKPRRRC